MGYGNIAMGEYEPSDGDGNGAAMYMNIQPGMM
jgi:hypothetical protein|eukprot:CAMPEP_0170063912 /NCGR_PEP_ID=MMETSP0019_2-20121128/4602_1 /TAXON_ID=98059 /ORGANISM="Dinobryon sp., Strain UTEXLB2267" /LENGTH=32 /DNA_ID= /DNA_START= /DNA_END= /DNA_ORIENTATION=